ncbi:MAG: alanine--glyoxylate aminotransferase family protein [Myxococcales bacterium]|nr:alanine--glyoxylate aminotransferase family protein [Myxococcales bacterium]
MDPIPPQLDPPSRLLMGPGPSPVHPRVLAALSAPTVGHLDPYFLAIMDETRTLLQRLFGTTSALSFPVSGTGSAGMEACLANAVEPGDRVVIAQNGVFGGRMADMVERLGGDLVRVEVPFGQAIDPERVRAAIANKPTKLVGIVHAETSTGVAQELQEIAQVAHEVEALLLADCVTSLGGIPVALDTWGVDLAYAGTQKCLSCPPGLAPVSFSQRAIEAIRTRRHKVASWYLDATLLLNYWSGERVYHHTAPVNMVYGLREALRVVMQEGLAQVYARHQLHHRALVAGLEAMGLRMLVSPPLRLPQLNTVEVPEGVDDVWLRRTLLDDFNIEIGGGLGAFKGKALRIGLMGHGARREHVVTLLSALESVLGAAGVNVPGGAGVHAANQVWHAAASR